MLVNKIKIPKQVNFSYPVVIYVLSDTHLNAPTCDEEKLKKHIELIAREMTENPNTFWIHAGDWCDFIGPKDRRFNTDDYVPSIIEQISNAKAIFRPIAEGCIGAISGNHDHTIAAHYGDAVRDICNDLQLPYLGDSGFIHLQMSDTYGDRGRRFSFVIYMTHGYGGGRKYGAKVNKVQDLAQYIDANFYIMGHMHTYVPVDNKALGVSRNGTLKTRDRFFINCPSYYKVYTNSDRGNYASRASYPPSTTGMVRITISGPESVKVEMVR